MCGSYSVDCYCSNCECNGSKSFPNGQKVPDVFECPNCGCCTAKKKIRDNIQYPFYPKPKYKKWIPYPFDNDKYQLKQGTVCV